MAELQPGEGQQPNGGVPPPEATTFEALATASATPGISVSTKRMRRPSVRLGDIGGGGGDLYNHVAYDSQAGRSKWKPTGNRKYQNLTGKSSRTRTLTNLSSGNENSGTVDEEREGNVESMGVGGWRVKKRVGSSTKRGRWNWVSKTEEAQNNFDQGDEKYSGGEELGDGFRDFSREDSESPMKEESPENSTEKANEREGFNNRGRRNGKKRSRNRGSWENRELEISEPSEMEGGGEWGKGGGREGVKIWLEGLGLGRYWPVFEIHEVDEEVLPLLTLEDLKDMGINAVGSRRKMYCAIDKLGREFD